MCTPRMNHPSPQPSRWQPTELDSPTPCISPLDLPARPLFLLTAPSFAAPSEPVQRTLRSFVNGREVPRNRAARSPSSNFFLLYPPTTCLARAPKRVFPAIF